MATVKGNIEALQEVASQLFPPVRSGQAAHLDQDTAGPPFATRDLDVTGSYDLANPTFTAPSWVYGLTLDSCESGTSVFVAFGSTVPGDLEATPQSPTGPECTLVPGQTLSFPRGARRVFLRSDVSQVIRVTWTLDRFADKRFGCPCDPGGSGVLQVLADEPLVSSGGANPVIGLTGIVSALHGGTGLSSPGSSGNVLTSNGTAWVSSPGGALGNAAGVLRGTYPNPTMIGPTAAGANYASYLSVDGPLASSDKVYLKGANLQPIGMIGGYNAEVLITGGDGTRGIYGVDYAGAAVLQGGHVTNYASPVAGGDAYVTGGRSDGPGGTGPAGNVWLGFKIPTADPNAGKWDTVDAHAVYVGKGSGSQLVYLQEQELDLKTTPPSTGQAIVYDGSKWVPAAQAASIVTLYSGLHHKTNTSWEQIGACVITGSDFANRTISFEGTGVVSTLGETLEVQLVNLATAAVVLGPLQITTTGAGPVSISGAALASLGNVALGVEIRMIAGGTSGYLYGASLRIS